MGGPNAMGAQVSGVNARADIDGQSGQVVKAETGIPGQARPSSTHFAACDSMFGKNENAESRGKTPSPEISMLEKFAQNDQLVILGAESKPKFKRLDSTAAKAILREVLTNVSADNKLTGRVFQKLNTIGMPVFETASRWLEEVLASEEGAAKISVEQCLRLHGLLSAELNGKTFRDSIMDKVRENLHEAIKGNRSVAVEKILDIFPELIYDQGVGENRQEGALTLAVRNLKEDIVLSVIERLTQGKSTEEAKQINKNTCDVISNQLNHKMKGKKDKDKEDLRRVVLSATLGMPQKLAQLLCKGTDSVFETNVTSTLLVYAAASEDKNTMVEQFRKLTIDLKKDDPEEWATLIKQEQLPRALILAADLVAAGQTEPTTLTKLLEHDFPVINFDANSTCAAALMSECSEQSVKILHQAGADTTKTMLLIAGAINFDGVTQEQEKEIIAKAINTLRKVAGEAGERERFHTGYDALCEAALNNQFTTLENLLSAGFSDEQISDAVQLKEQCQGKESLLPNTQKSRESELTQTAKQVAEIQRAMPNVTPRQIMGSFDLNLNRGLDRSSLLSYPAEQLANPNNTVLQILKNALSTPGEGSSAPAPRSA